MDRRGKRRYFFQAGELGPSDPEQGSQLGGGKCQVATTDPAVFSSVSGKRSAKLGQIPIRAALSLPSSNCMDEKPRLDGTERQQRFVAVHLARFGDSLEKAVAATFQGRRVTRAAESSEGMSDGSHLVGQWTREGARGKLSGSAVEATEGASVEARKWERRAFDRSWYDEQRCQGHHGDRDEPGLPSF